MRIKPIGIHYMPVMVVAGNFSISQGKNTLFCIVLVFFTVSKVLNVSHKSCECSLVTVTVGTYLFL